MSIFLVFDINIRYGTFQGFSLRQIASPRRHIRMLLRRAQCRPYISIRAMAHLLAGRACIKYARDRPVSAGRDPWAHPQVPLLLPVPSTTTTISNLAWLSCNDVMLGRANWVVDGLMAGYRRELLEILEIDWEARPRCGTQSSKEDRRRENQPPEPPRRRTQLRQPNRVMHLLRIAARPVTCLGT